MSAQDPPFGTPAPDADERLPWGSSETAGWLHVEHFKAAHKPRAVVVFSHGFSAYAAPYRHVAHALRNVGFATTLFDARGHGHSTGKRGHIEAFDDYRCDLESVIAAALQFHGDAPLALIGHSMGGLVVLDYLLSTKSKARPTCAVVAAPMLQIDILIAKIGRPFIPLLNAVLPRVALPNGITGAAITRNPYLQTGFDLDPLLHHQATPRWFSTSLDAQRQVRKEAKNFKVRTLCFTAGQDQIVSNKAQAQFATQAPTQTIERHLLEGCYHEIFLDPGYGAVIAHMVEWLSTQLPEK